MIFEDEKNRKKRFQGCVSAFIVLNFFKITSEMVLCYMNQYPYALWMAFFTTLLTVVVITVSAMIFYKTIGSCFCGSYIVNVRNLKKTQKNLTFVKFFNLKNVLLLMIGF